MIIAQDSLILQPHLKIKNIIYDILRAKNKNIPFACANVLI